MMEKFAVGRLHVRISVPAPQAGMGDRRIGKSHAAEPEFQPGFNAGFQGPLRGSAKHKAPNTKIPYELDFIPERQRLLGHASSGG